jgi:heme exporter protein D
MSYQNYVIAAYAVFGIVLLWDLLAPRFLLRAQLRAARLRAARGTSRPAQPELIR